MAQVFLRGFSTDGLDDIESLELRFDRLAQNFAQLGLVFEDHAVLGGQFKGEVTRDVGPLHLGDKDLLYPLGLQRITEFTMLVPSAM
jgi:hypothetical protein